MCINCNFFKNIYNQIFGYKPIKDHDSDEDIELLIEIDRLNKEDELDKQNEQNELNELNELDKRIDEEYYIIDQVL